MATQQITLRVDENLLVRAQHEAEKTKRTVEAVLEDWLWRSADDPPLETLSNDEIVALANMQMEEAKQEELSDLHYEQRERRLSVDEQRRLDALMQLYRSGLVRKAQALRIAVQRGLIPPLGS